MSSWRDVLSVHPAADLFPLLGDAELVALGEDIKRNGLTSPIAIKVENDDEPILLDGRNRLDAMERVGLRVGIVMTQTGPWRLIALEDLDGRRLNIDERLGDTVTVVYSDPVEYITSANINRRHLMAETKRDLIAKLLKEHPERSNRATAKLVGVDNKTVAAVRRKEEDVRSIPHVAKRVDTKGRKQPASKPQVKAGKPPTVTALAEKKVSTMPPDTPVTVTESPEALDDPLVLYRDDEIEATPWFSSKIKPIFDGSVKNDEVKSALALAGFKRACVTFLPQSTIKDLETAQNIFGVISDLQYDVEGAQREAKYAAADAKRIKWEASHPEQAKNKAREKAQRDAMENDKDDAKAEFRESGELWGDVKEEWIDEWITDNWCAEEEAKFEKNFQEQWVREHNTPAESDPPITNTKASTKAEATPPDNPHDGVMPDIPPFLDRRPATPEKALG
jgi:hypothetical protein